MKNRPTPAEINELFKNDDPKIVWDKATYIIRRMSPAYDFTLVQSVYEDVMGLFHGEYPGYGPIKTLYHDLPHTLEVFLCGVRLMHGVHVSGDHLQNEEITMIMLAILMHDVGYAQRRGRRAERVHSTRKHMFSAALNSCGNISPSANFLQILR